ncbi:hypothetical protein TGMAS_212780 [Toxoplasma gondii MAS]|uniref:Uncharacterized protein n=1 Tax=Toxoplasma gondii MAS TaxID=943118 RepID=A0A086QCQ1_TOXGO|nr:hypothetical protein TGMAS_212780 [Toxoplasma gondii MAS]
MPQQRFSAAVGFGRRADPSSSSSDEENGRKLASLRTCFVNTRGVKSGEDDVWVEVSRNPVQRGSARGSHSHSHALLEDGVSSAVPSRLNKGATRPRAGHAYLDSGEYNQESNRSEEGETEDEEGGQHAYYSWAREGESKTRGETQSLSQHRSPALWQKNHGQDSARRLGHSGAGPEEECSESDDDDRSSDDLPDRYLRQPHPSAFQRSAASYHGSGSRYSTGRGSRHGDAEASESGQGPSIVEPTVRRLQESSAREVMATVVEPRLKWKKSLEAFQSCLRMAPSDDEAVGYESDEEDEREAESSRRPEVHLRGEASAEDTGHRKLRFTSSRSHGQAGLHTYPGQDELEDQEEEEGEDEEADSDFAHRVAMATGPRTGRRSQLPSERNKGDRCPMLGQCHDEQMSRRLWDGEDEEAEAFYRGDTLSRQPPFASRSVSLRSYPRHTPREDSEDEEQQLAELKTYVNKKLSTLDRRYGAFRGGRRADESEDEEEARAVTESRKAYRGTLLAALASGMGANDDKKSPRSPRFGSADDTDWGEDTVSSPSFGAKSLKSPAWKQTREMVETGDKQRAALLSSGLRLTSQGDADTASTLTSTPRIESIRLSSPASSPSSFSASFPSSENVVPKENVGSGVAGRVQQMMSVDEADSKGEIGMRFMSVEEHDAKLKALQDRYRAKYAELKRTPILTENAEAEEEGDTAEVQNLPGEIEHEPRGDAEEEDVNQVVEEESPRAATDGEAEEEAGETCEREDGTDGEDGIGNGECGEQDTVAPEGQATEEEKEAEVHSKEAEGDVIELAEEEQEEGVATLAPEEAAEECAEEHEAEAGNAAREEDGGESPPGTGEEEKKEKSNIKSQVVEALQDVLLSVLRPPASLPSNSVSSLVPPFDNVPAPDTPSACATPSAVAARSLLAALFGRTGSLSSSADSKEPLPLTEISPRGMRENEKILQRLENASFASAESNLWTAAAAVVSGNPARALDTGDGIIRSVLPSPRDHPGGGSSETAWKASGAAVATDWTISLMRQGRDGEELRRAVCPREFPLDAFHGVSADGATSFDEASREFPTYLANAFRPAGSSPAVAGSRFDGVDVASFFVGRETEKHLPFDHMRVGEGEEGRDSISHVPLFAGISGGFQVDNSVVTMPHSSLPCSPERQQPPHQEEGSFSETDRSDPQIPSAVESSSACSPSSDSPHASPVSSVTPKLRTLSETGSTVRRRGRGAASVTSRGEKAKETAPQTGGETPAASEVSRRTSTDCTGRDKLNEVRRQLKERVGFQKSKSIGDQRPKSRSASGVSSRRCVSRPTTPREIATSTQRQSQSFFSFEGPEVVRFPTVGELRRQLDISQHTGIEGDRLNGKGGTGSAAILALLAGSSRLPKRELPVPPPGRPRDSGRSETETGKATKKQSGLKTERPGRKSLDQSQELSSWIVSPPSRMASSVALCTTTAGGSSPRDRERTTSYGGDFENEEHDEERCAASPHPKQTTASGSGKRVAETEKTSEKKGKGEGKRETGELGHGETKKAAVKAKEGRGGRKKDKKKAAEEAHQSEQEQPIFTPAPPSCGGRGIQGSSKKSKKEKTGWSGRRVSCSLESESILDPQDSVEAASEQESEATEKDLEAERHRQEMEAHKEEQALLLSATQKHVQEVHKELERLVRENATLQEEKQQQEIKVRQILKTASRTNLQLLALKAQQPAWERLKKNEEQHHELEALEKELDSLKRSVQERTSREHGTIVDLQARLASTEQLLKERTEEVARKRVAREEEERIREIVCMQVEEWRLRCEAQAETRQRLTTRLSGAEQAKTQLESKLAEMLKLMERVKAALVATRNEAEEHKKARESAEKELIWKHAKSVSCGVQTDTARVKHSGDQADLQPQKDVRTVAVQVGHPNEKSLQAQDSVRDQKLTSALAKQKQLTLQVRAEHKKRASAWSAEKAELQALVISLQGRIAELEKIQKLTSGNKSSGPVNPGLGPFHANSYASGYALQVASLCSPGMAPGFVASPFPLPPVSRVSQSVRDNATEKDAGRHGTRRKDLVAPVGAAPEFAEQEEQELLDFVSDLIHSGDAGESPVVDRVPETGKEGKEHEDHRAQQPERRDDEHDVIAEDLRAMDESVKVLEDQLEERLRILGTHEDNLDAQGDNRQETETGEKKVEAPGGAGRRRRGVAWTIDEKPSITKDGLRSEARSSPAVSPRTVGVGTYQSRSTESSASVFSRNSPSPSRLDSLLDSPVDALYAEAALSGLEETGLAELSFPGASAGASDSSGDFVQTRSIGQIFAEKTAVPSAHDAPQTAPSGGKNSYDSISQLLTESRRETRTSSAREKVQELRRQLREHGVLS